MEGGQIFGSDITLPSLPGLQSDCEEEILLLMKEIDGEFERKHHTLLTELINIRSLCRAQRDEIENLRYILQSSNEDMKKDNSKEKIKGYLTEIEKLKRENNELKAENCALQRRIQNSSDSEFQLDRLKRSISVQQDENKVLRKQLSKAEEQHQSFQDSYRKVVHTLASFHQRDGSQGRHQIGDLSSVNSNVEINQTTEKFLSVEKEFCNDFLSKMNQELDNVERRFQKEVS